MSNQINPSVTTPSIADIFQDISKSKLVLQPDFQRKFVWSIEHQEEFIDTILKGYPFPEIYVCDGEVDMQKIQTTQHVIDGQQRLTTIKMYMDNAHKPFKHTKSFADLTDVERANFLSYKVVFRNIGKVDDTLIREIFRRINLTKFKLDDIEIHNAIYDGIFIQTAKSIIDDINLESFPVFSASEITRMADLFFLLTVMATLENDSYFPGDKDVEKFIAKFNDEYPNSQYIKSKLIKTFAIIDDLSLQNDSIWFRKSNSFTLIVEIAKNVDIIHNIDIIKEKLLKLEEDILANKNTTENEFGKYYSHMYSGTASRKSRIVRAEIFCKYIFN